MPVSLKLNIEQYLEDDNDNDNDSDYFSCLSDYEESHDGRNDNDEFDDDDDESENSDFSMTRTTSLDSNLSDVIDDATNHKPLFAEIIKQDQSNHSPLFVETKESTYKLLFVETIKEKESSRIRSPIDITFPTKLLNKIKPINSKPMEPNHPGEIKETACHPSLVQQRLRKLKDDDTSMASKFNHPMAPIINGNDPFFEINKKYSYGLYMSEQIRKTSKLQQNPMISRFFPLGNQQYLPLIGEVNNHNHNHNHNLPFVGETNNINHTRHSSFSIYSLSSLQDDDNSNLDSLLGHHRRRASLHL